MAESSCDDVDNDMPDPASDREPAEGSREAVNLDEGGGITNRSRRREAEEQQRVPERGRRKSETEG